jgi:hypothetical protein
VQGESCAGRHPFLESDIVPGNFSLGHLRIQIFRYCTWELCPRVFADSDICTWAIFIYGFSSCTWEFCLVCRGQDTLGAESRVKGRPKGDVGQGERSKERLGPARFLGSSLYGVQGLGFRALKSFSPIGQQTRQVLGLDARKFETFEPNLLPRSLQGSYRGRSLAHQWQKPQAPALPNPRAKSTTSIFERELSRALLSASTAEAPEMIDVRWRNPDPSSTVAHSSSHLSVSVWSSPAAPADTCLHEDRFSKYRRHGKLWSSLRF